MKSTAPLLVSLALLSAPAFAQEAATAPAAEAAPEAAPAADAPAAAEAPAAEAAAAPAPAADAPATAAAPATATAAAVAVANDGTLDPKVLSAIGAPAEGKARIVFFRPGKFVGAAVGFIVREKDAELGKLRNSNWFAVDVEPGTHEYTVHAETKDVTNIEAEAGETYFLVGSIGMGVFAGHPNLAPSDATAFGAALPKLKPSKPLN